MSQPATTQPATEPSIVDATTDKIIGMIKSGRIHLPADYSVENALKEAWLTLQSVVDKDKRPALKVCTNASIARALLNMAVQGLNPGKRQCYFIVYDDQLTLSRSYFGDIAVAERVMPGIEVVYQVVYKGDKLTYKIERGRKQVSVHEQSIENVRPENITAAYCEVYSEDGCLVESEVMTIDRIKKSWTMSKTYRPDGNGTHNQYPDSMALRTVIRKVCLKVINKSNDAELMASVRLSDELAAEASIDAEAAEFANREILSIESSSSVEQIPVETSTGQPVLVEVSEPGGAKGQGEEEAPY